MTLAGTFTFAGPRAAVWDLLQDPAALAKALPGAKTLTKTAADRYDGVMSVSIGPVTAAEFKVTVTLKDQAPPSHMRLQIEGTGGVGSVRGSASVDLLDAPNAETTMNYSSDVHVGGRIAAVGQRLIESASKMMMRQALDALSAELQARMKARA